MRILIAEDEPVQLRLLQSLLTKWGHEVTVATNGKQAWSALTAENSPNFAILDWIMPGMNGIRITRELRGLPNRPYTYILMLTARDHKKDLVEALESGADDFLAKPFDAQELKARLLAGKRLIDLQEQLLTANGALQFQASHDSLTGVFNRGAVLEMLFNEFARSRRERKPVGVMIADIDHFKHVNDTYGHTTGDVVLHHVAQTIRTVVRTYDSVGRYGGEEFLIVVPGCDSRVAQEKAEQIRRAIAGSGIDAPGKKKITATLSIGVVSVCDPLDYQKVLDTADEALYRAKRSGRDRVEVGELRAAAEPVL
jgi:two-component system, cell cycle response regulator